MSEYLGILLLLAASAVVAGAMASLNAVLGPRRPGEVKQSPFECGKDPFALPAGRFEVHFYLTALLFILFDVELVFLYPWAVACRTLGAAGAAQMAVFLGVLMVGFWYAWDNGALEWE